MGGLQPVASDMLMAFNALENTEDGQKGYTKLLAALDGERPRIIMNENYQPPKEEGEVIRVGDPRLLADPLGQMQMRLNRFFTVDRTNNAIYLWHTRLEAPKGLNNVLVVRASDDIPPQTILTV